MNWLLEWHIWDGIGAWIAVAAIALLLGTNRRIAVRDATVGMLSWIVYKIFLDRGGGDFLSTLIATALVACYAQYAARKHRVPVTVLTIPTLYPMVPGGQLFRAVDAFVFAKDGAVADYGKQAILTSLGIALGLLFVERFFRIIYPSDRKKIEEKS